MHSISSSENLARADLSGIELEEHRVEWARLIELKRQEAADLKKQAELDLKAKGAISGRDAAKKPRTHRATGEKKGRPKGGTAQAARDQGVSPRTLGRSKDIVDNLTSEAKAKAVELDSPQAALLAAAALEGTEAQIASLREHADRAVRQAKQDAEAALDAKLTALEKFFDAQGEEVQRRFVVRHRDRLLMLMTMEILDGRITQ